ncbi:MAG: hypothetical protein ACYCX4_00740 [Bacillota bacterium]
MAFKKKNRNQGSNNQIAASLMGSVDQVNEEAGISPAVVAAIAGALSLVLEKSQSALNITTIRRISSGDSTDWSRVGRQEIMSIRQIYR